MADSYDRYENESSGGGFMMGLLTGTVLGAGLGILLAPKAGAELRGAIGEQARNWGNTASEQYRHARETAGTWAEKGRDMVNQAREAATNAAEQARGYAGGATGSSYGSTGSSYGGNSGTTGSTGSTGGYGSPTGSDFNRS
ncbi:MAG TPA: YtxH domain-containing protein [Vicinamibacterales bacterium]